MRHMPNILLNIEMNIKVERTSGLWVFVIAMIAKSSPMLQRIRFVFYDSSQHVKLYHNQTAPTHDGYGGCLLI